jgi:uncharacterized membrane protein YcjF (UPF0283 family)
MHNSGHLDIAPAASIATSELRTPGAARGIAVCSNESERAGGESSPPKARRFRMTRNVLLRLELLVLLTMMTAGCQMVEGIFKAGMWVGILLVVVVVGIVFMVFGRSGS